LHLVEECVNMSYTTSALERGYLMSGVLEVEIKTYESHRDELIGTNSGKFVLIKGEKVIGIFDTQLDAINAGYERFGNVPFLVKQIMQVEVPHNFTSNLIGV